MGVLEGFIDSLFPPKKNRTDDGHPVACRGKMLHRFADGTLGKLLHDLKGNGRYINRITVYNGPKGNSTYCRNPIPERCPSDSRFVKHTWLSTMREKEIDDSILERRVLGYDIISNRVEDWNSLSEGCKRYWPTPDSYPGTPDKYPILNVYVEYAYDWNLDKRRVAG